MLDEAEAIEREQRSRDILGWEDVETVTVRGPMFRVARTLITLIVVGGLIWFGYSRARGWFDAQLDPPGPPGDAVTFVVPSGATTSDIARLLEEADIIPNSTFFRYYTRWHDEGNFQAGEYTIAQNSSVADAIEILNAGPKPIETMRFTVREGLWVPEILESIAAQVDHITVADLQAALASGRIPARYRPEGVDSWEGLLYPETYEIHSDDSAEAILLRMTDEFSSVTGRMGFGASESISGYTAYEVIIIASIIEAEVQRPEERELVAAVIYNRLRDGDLIQFDATCVYALGERGVPLTLEHLNEPGPYNCRHNNFLPPTPINSPGRASLEAALNPAKVDYKYYALTGEDGSHSFAATLEEHNENVAICREMGLC